MSFPRKPAHRVFSNVIVGTISLLWAHFTTELSVSLPLPLVSQGFRDAPKAGTAAFLLGQVRSPPLLVTDCRLFAL